MIEVFNNVLDDSNREGWRTLQSVSIISCQSNNSTSKLLQAGLMTESELLLNSAERYAMMTAMSLNTSDGEQRNQTLRQSRMNIGKFKI